jgi:manganese/zinc/iron transport system permease protein
VNSITIYILLIASLTAFACAIPGTFLVLRGVSLMSDAISHAILPGIVLMFFLVHQLDSPLLIFGAALAGVATVVCTEMIIYTRCLRKDAAIGIVFPLFFSVGVILISQFARNVHLDIDMVLLGELAFAPFNSVIIDGINYGPMALWLMGVIVLLNLSFVFLFYKELKLITFDYEFARVIGYRPLAVYYGLMFIASITTVGAFDAVGAIVVVALMIVPAATARLISDRLLPVLVISGLTGVVAALSGYAFAQWADVSIAGAIALMSGVLFAIAFLLDRTLPYGLK